MKLRRGLKIINDAIFGIGILLFVFGSAMVVISYLLTITGFMDIDYMAHSFKYNLSGAVLGLVLGFGSNYVDEKLKGV